jgi:hypothetical protein
MRIDGGAAQYLELHLVGYEFQHAARQSDGFDWDANWLVVAGQASDGERAWSFRDPCLLTTDARRLVAWLELVADGSPQDDALDFLEPNLEFRRVSSPGDQPVVRVIFRLESAPPWAPDVAEEDWDNAYLDFETSPDALRAAANELRAELERYPER